MLSAIHLASAQNNFDEEAAEEFLATYDDRYGKLDLAWDYETNITAENASPPPEWYVGKVLEQSQKGQHLTNSVETPKHLFDLGLLAGLMEDEELDYFAFLFN